LASAWAVRTQRNSHAAELSPVCKIPFRQLHPSMPERARRVYGLSGAQRTSRQMRISGYIACWIGFRAPPKTKTIDGRNEPGGERRRRSVSGDRGSDQADAGSAGTRPACRASIGAAQRRPCSEPRPAARSRRTARRAWGRGASATSQGNVPSGASAAARVSRVARITSPNRVTTRGNASPRLRVEFSEP